MSNSSIWPIDRILSGATTLGQSGPWSNGNEEVLHIFQSSCITEVLPSDCLMSYLGHSLGGVLLFCRDAVGIFYNPSQQSLYICCIFLFSILSITTFNDLAPDISMQGVSHNITAYNSYLMNALKVWD